MSRGKQSKGVIIPPPKPPRTGGHLVPALSPAIRWYGRHGPVGPRSGLVSSPCSYAEEGAAALCPGNQDLCTCWVFLVFCGVFGFGLVFFLFGSFIDSESSTSTNWLTNNYKTSCREIEAGCWFPPSFTSVPFQSNVSSMLLIKFAVCGLCAKLGRVTLPRRKMTVEPAVHRLSRALQGN